MGKASTVGKILGKVYKRKIQYGSYKTMGFLEPRDGEFRHSAMKTYTRYNSGK
jgi:hypothetical protein